MINKILVLITLLILTISTAACRPPNQTPPPGGQGTPLANNPAGGLPAGCQPEPSLLNNLRDQLPQEQAVIVYQAYAGEHTLVVWLMAAELGSRLPEANQQQALDIAINTAEILIGASVCVGKFDLLHITVVGADYTQWFSGPIRPMDLGGGARANVGGGIGLERGGGLAVVTAAPSDPPLESDCDWASANADLDQQFADQLFQSDFYFIRDQGGSLVFAHWVLPAGDAPEDLLPLLENVTAPLTCLYPRPTGISLTITSEDGGVLLSGFLPGDAQRRKTKFNVSDLSYQLLEAP